MVLVRLPRKDTHFSRTQYKARTDNGFTYMRIQQEHVVVSHVFHSLAPGDLEDDSRPSPLCRHKEQQDMLAEKVSIRWCWSAFACTTRQEFFSVSLHCSFTICALTAMKFGPGNVDLLRREKKCCGDDWRSNGGLHGGEQVNATL